MQRLVVVVCVLVACSLSVPVTPSAVPPTAAATAQGSSPPSAGVRREPGLAVFPEEDAVLGALSAAGIELSRVLVAPSHYESFLGQPRRARVFIVSDAEGADVVFLGEPIVGLRICVSTAPSGLERRELFVGDRLIGVGEAVEEAFYLVSDRYFISGIGDRFRTALSDPSTPRSGSDRTGPGPAPRATA